MCLLSRRQVHNQSVKNAAGKGSHEFGASVRDGLHKMWKRGFGSVSAYRRQTGSLSRMLQKAEGRDADGFQESVESEEKRVGGCRPPSTDVVKAT